MLNAMSALIPDDQRIIVIEDSTELQLQQPHLLYYETRPADRAGRGEITMRQLFRSAMRMRPDRVIIGEVRGGECIDMIQAMTSGHKGSMSTVHASSPRETLSRIETLALMGGLDIPLWALRSQIGMALDVLVQVTRHTDGSRKVSSICEVTGTDKDNEYMVRELFVWKGLGKDQQGRVLGQLEPSGLLPTFAEHIKLAGVRFPREMIDAARARKAELERRRADRDGGPRDSA
jgi:pilus assembly protein CpaF